MARETLRYSIASCCFLSPGRKRQRSVHKHDIRHRTKTNADPNTDIHSVCSLLLPEQRRGATRCGVRRSPAPIMRVDKRLEAFRRDEGTGRRSVEGTPREMKVLQPPMSPRPYRDRAYPR